MSRFSSIALIGSGSWATALAWLLSRHDITLNWWVREENARASLAQTGQNPTYLPDVRLPTRGIVYSASPAAAIAEAEATLLAIPSKYLADALSDVPKEIFAGKWVASAIKGLVPVTGQSVSDYLKTRYGVRADHFTVVTGPSHAEEVVHGQTTFLTCGSAQALLAQRWADSLAGPTLHTRLSNDVEGLEFAGILKNIYAIGMGMAIGLGYGDNFRAVLAAACIREMEDHLAQEHPNPARNVTDSPYLGDLLVTVYSPYSRNRQLGQLIGEGRTAMEAVGSMPMVAEGHTTAEVLFGLAKPPHLPIARAVYEVLHRERDPQEAITSLLDAIR